MKKFGYAIAALGVIAIAAPSIASAEDVVIKRGDREHHRMGEFRDHREFRGDRERIGARAEFREHREFRDRGWRHGHGDKVVVIKKHRHHDER